MKKADHLIAAVLTVMLVAALSLPGLLVMLGMWYLLSVSEKYSELKHESVNC